MLASCIHLKIKNYHFFHYFFFRRTNLWKIQYRSHTQLIVSSTVILPSYKTSNTKSRKIDMLIAFRVAWGENTPENSPIYFRNEDASKNYDFVLLYFSFVYKDKKQIVFNEKS